MFVGAPTTLGGFIRRLECRSQLGDILAGSRGDRDIFDGSLVSFMEIGKRRRKNFVRHEIDIFAGRRQ